MTTGSITAGNDRQPGAIRLFLRLLCVPFLLPRILHPLHVPVNLKPNSNRQSPPSCIASRGFFRAARKKARGVHFGGAAVAGVAFVGTAALAGAALTVAWRRRSIRLEGKAVLITGSSRGIGSGHGGRIRPAGGAHRAHGARP